MKSTRMLTVVTVVVGLGVSVLAVLGVRAISAQDTGQAKYTVRVPNGLAFSEFKGYESWQTISVSHNEKGVMALILGNPSFGNEGWRWLFAIGVVPALFTLWIRRNVRES